MELPIWIIIGGPLATMITTLLVVLRFLREKESLAVNQATAKATSDGTLRLRMEELKFEQLSIRDRVLQLEGENQRSRDEVKSDMGSFKAEFMHKVEKLDFKIDKLMQVVIEEISHQNNKPK